jgi:hypothetical protein
MANPGMFLKPTILAIIILLSSCIDVPVELKLTKTLEITEEQIQQTAEALYQELSNISAPSVCIKAYKSWLKKQFDLGLIPSGIIKPSEYAFASGIKTDQCPNINLDELYKKASKEASKIFYQQSTIVYIRKIRNLFPDNRCAKNFFHSKSKKIIINTIYADIKENTLDFTFPKFIIFTSKENLSKEELEENDTIEKYIENKQLLPAAETKKIPPRFTGMMPLELAKDNQSLVPITSLKGVLVIVPDIKEPITKKISGRDYYVVPAGKSISLSFITKYDVIGTLADAKCVYDIFKEFIKKEDEEHRKNHDNKK